MAVGADRCGGVYVAGIEADREAREPWAITVKYGRNGDREWVARRAGVVTDLAVDRAGNVLVTDGIRTMRYPASCDGPRFVRGDCDGDGVVDEDGSDAMVLLAYNFLGERELSCMAACDADGDGMVVGQVGDAVYLLAYCFLQTAPPVAPFPWCGRGELAGDVGLGCEGSAGSCR